MIALPLVSRLPVDQLDGQLLPIAAALDGDVAHPVAHNLIFAHHLVAAVLEDEAVIGGRDKLIGLERQRRLGLRGAG